jgi:hypothetical protein
VDPEDTHDDAPAAAPRSARTAPSPRSDEKAAQSRSTDARAPLTRELRSAEGARDELRTSEAKPAPGRPAPSEAPADTRASRRTADLRGADVRGADLRGVEYRMADRRPVDPPVPTNIYRARRPAVAALLVIPAVGVGILLVRALAIAGFGTPFHTGGVIASALGLAALPLIVAGLYGLITGAAHGAEQWGFRVWARPPLAYLLVGIAFAVAAGLAIT